MKENESNFTLCFILGWFVTCLAGIIDYPIDTVRRRMMMTSGETLKYRNSIDCAIQIIKLEGFKAMMKGASANVLRTAAGAGVLAGSDKLKELYFSHKFRLKTWQGYYLNHLYCVDDVAEYLWSLYAVIIFNTGSFKKCIILLDGNMIFVVQIKWIGYSKDL